MEDESLTLDLLYSMLNPDLEQLMTKYSIPTVDCKKLLGALDLLSTYYGMCAMHCERSGCHAYTGPGHGCYFCHVYLRVCWTCFKLNHPVLAMSCDT